MFFCKVAIGKFKNNSDHIWVIFHVTDLSQVGHYLTGSCGDPVAPQESVKGLVLCIVMFW